MICLDSKTFTVEELLDDPDYMTHMHMQIVEGAQQILGQLLSEDGWWNTDNDGRMNFYQHHFFSVFTRAKCPSSTLKAYRDALARIASRRAFQNINVRSAILTDFFEVWQHLQSYDLCKAIIVMDLEGAFDFVLDAVEVA